jgi:hypothetical protein
MRIKNATMFEDYEPGDATRYRVFYSMDAGSIYIAIGAGDIVDGGYPLQVDQLAYEFAMIKGEKTTPASLLDSHLIGYWRGHMRGDVDKWTATVAIILAAVILFGDMEDEQHMRLPGLLYHHRWQEAQTVIGEMNV